MDDLRAFSFDEPAAQPQAVEPATPPKVAAVLVVSNGVAWLGRVLASLAAQTYQPFDFVVVDNGSSDGSTEILTRRIPAQRLIALPDNEGFAGAVQVALAHETVTSADLVLLLHDDLSLARDAVALLVRGLVQDPALGVVGPKLLEWSHEPVLQQLGMTIDRFGRAEPEVEPGELDQGQHDQQRDVLYVSTAGMLVRRPLLDGDGGFDRRFPAFRDDLDLCWRMWLRGQRVGVVPEALAYHIASSARGERPVARGRRSDARYLAERHSVAALLKNYGAARLVWVLPLLILLAVAKVVAFVVTRQLGAAAAVVRAYAWNVRELPATRRARRIVQRGRERSDSELDRIFAPGLPRLRSYLDTFREWLAGGGTRALIPDSQVDPLREGDLAPLLRVLRRHPVGAAGVILLLAYLVGLAPWLGGGPLVGGQVAPWPASPVDFLRSYASPWNGEPVGGEAFASPIQAVLGALSYLGFGSAWLAQRLLVFGLVPLAWAFAARAGRLITTRTGPRILGATVYVLSPPVLGSLAEGRLGVLIAASLLPGLVLVGVRTTERTTRPATAWRATALLALGLALLVAAAPAVGSVLVVVLVAAFFLAAVLGGWQSLLRLLVAAGAAALLLAPWLQEIVEAGTLPAAPASAADLPLWRGLLVVPEVVGASPLAVAFSMGLTVTILLAGLVLGFRRRPGLVAVLVFVVVLSGMSAWVLGEGASGWIWPPALLLPAALGYAGLAVLVGRRLIDELAPFRGRWRRLGAGACTVAVLAGLIGGLVHVGGGPWAGLIREPELVPAFVAADEPRVGPYRVLLLDQAEDEVRWDVVGASGPTMLSFGAGPDERLLDHLETTLASVVGEADPTAASAFGVANVRYVVVTDAADEVLAAALGRQEGLEPLPSGGGAVFRVRAWLPRAVVLPPEAAESLLSTGDPGATDALEEDGLRQLRPDLYRGAVPQEGGVLVVAEASSEQWVAGGDGARLEREDVGAVNAFSVPSGLETVSARVVGDLAHRLGLVLQLVVLLAVVSLGLRPPGFATERRLRAAHRGLPVGVALPETARPETVESGHGGGR